MTVAWQRTVKLVRDRVAEFHVQGNDIDYVPVEFGGELKDLLMAKLGEEVTEYLMDPSVGELADIYEVLRALAHHVHNASIDDVAEEARSKFVERGGFVDGVKMVVTSQAPPTHEGKHYDGRHG